MRLVRITPLLLSCLVTVPYTSSNPTQIGDPQYTFPSHYPQILDSHILTSTRRVDTDLASTNIPPLRQRDIWLTNFGKGWVQYLETFES